MRTTPLSLVALVSVSMVARTALAGDEALVPYTVQKGDSCDTIAQKVLGDSSLTEILHKYNPQLGPRPHHLKEGSVLMLPPPSPDARLELVRNKVEVQSKPGKPDDPLWRGNRVSTGESSAAEMKFRDQTELSMGEHTLVIILGITRTSVAKSSDATLVNGALRSRLADLAGRGGKPVAIDTPSANVALGAGETQLTVDPKKATRLAVYKGRSAVTALQTTVKVDQGFGSKTIPGKAPGSPRPLPAAPDWKPAPPALSFTQGAALDLAGEYAKGSAPGPDVATWHVQLAKDAAFHDLLVDTKVPVDVTRLEAKQVALGAAFARVSGIDADEFEGPWGATAKMVVARYEQREQPNHYGSIEPAFEGLVCGIDDARPVHASSRYDRLASHVLHCSLADAPSTSTAIDLPAEDVGGVTLKAHWLTSDLVAREGEAVLELSDGQGRPISRPGAAVTPLVAGAYVTGVETAYESGRYFVKTRWEPTTRSVRYHLALGGLAADSGPVAIDEPRVAEVADPGSVEAGLGAGVGIMGGGIAQVGARVEARVSLRAPVSFGDFTLGLAPTLERYGDVGISPSDVGLAAAPASLSVSHTDYGLGFPFGFRLGAPSVQVRPYVMITPQMLFQSSSFASVGQPSTDGSATYFGVLPVLGVELRLGPGALFLEGGYRAAVKLQDHFASVPLDGGAASLGYDLRF